ncbi:cytochrome c [Acetobacter sp. LMG 32666]|uniref:c-type cytochrome n=1 Tax=Acetobacter sp. LMG 32666 TaxID=2959295 RepID=UPI0030C8CBAC
MRKIFLFSAALSAFVLSGVARADRAAPTSTQMVDMPSGEAVYKHICQSCHMADGQGAVGAGARIPALVHNPRLQIASYPATVILNGYGGMPWFSGMLNDRQVADVVAYIRTHFGNDYKDPLNPADVAFMRLHLTPEAE